jgi:hypothetical protein
LQHNKQQQGMRHAFQITLGILSLIPLVFGLSGLLLGTGRFLPADDIVPQLDGQFRFLSGWYLSLAMLIWWMIPNFERHITLFRILCGAIFIGGVGRIISLLVVGTPPSFQIAATVFELCVPLLAVWQARLARTTM